MPGSPFFKGSGKDPAYLPQVIEKLEAHSKKENLDLSSTDLRQLALKLTNTELMEEYFSEHTFDLRDIGDGILSVNTSEENSAASVNGATNGEKTSSEAAPAATSIGATRQDRSKQIASFPVKLYLTALPQDSAVLNNTVASALEEKFGPMKASLQIGQTMIEWTPDHLVIPHFDIPTDPVIKTNITEQLGILAELRKKAKEKRTSVMGEIDLFNKPKESIRSLIRDIIQVIVTYNRYHSYDVYIRNSQHFVQNVLVVLKIEDLSIQSEDLSKYITQLKDGNPTQTKFRNHAELDSYVQQRINDLRTAEMEYLLTEYYRLHLASRTRADGMQEWKCEEKGCQRYVLEEHIAGKELLVKSL